MPAHADLSSELSVSIKTIHDALKTLIDEGILLARRGRYGTTVTRIPNDKSVYEKKETSIFAQAQDTAFYYYEKTQNHVKPSITWLKKAILHFRADATAEPLLLIFLKWKNKHSNGLPLTLNMLKFIKIN